MLKDKITINQNRSEVLVTAEQWQRRKDIHFKFWTDPLKGMLKAAKIGKVNSIWLLRKGTVLYQPKQEHNEKDQAFWTEFSLKDLADHIDGPPFGSLQVHLFLFEHDDIETATEEFGSFVLWAPDAGSLARSFADSKHGAVGHGSSILRLRLPVECLASPETISEGEHTTVEAAVLAPVDRPFSGSDLAYQWDFGGKGSFSGSTSRSVIWHSDGLSPDVYRAKVSVKLADDGRLDEIGSGSTDIAIRERPLSANDTIAVTLARSAVERTSDQSLNMMIRNSTQAISFASYKKFIDAIMCSPDPEGAMRKHPEYREATSRAVPFPFIDPYRRLKTASEIFLMARCGVKRDRFDPDEEKNRLGFEITRQEFDALWHGYLTPLDDPGNPRTLPYLALIRHKLDEIPLKDNADTSKITNCYGILQSKLTNPCLMELIWSYWHEESMLVQTMNAISLRFQNRKGPGDRSALTNLDIDPLRPLGNILWGYIQDQQHRLSVVRRAYEYDHHYGISLLGKAVPPLRAADSRSKFLESFHNLLNLCAAFYERDDDTTVIADAFPLLNSLKEVHLILAQGAHNQFGDLPSTARMEMLMEMWILARPEVRDFLGSRIMVPYKEGWMDRVDAMKKLHGWTDTSITHFNELAVFGEQLLLSIRYGNWVEINAPASAANWARYWRPEIQGYIHNYRSATGVDLTVEPVNTVLPAIHLQKRLAAQSAKA